jgi:hypothetical protein
VSKQAAQKFDGERCNLRKLNELEVRKQYQIKITNRFTALENLRGRGEACTGFWWGNLREGDHWGDPGVDGRIILRWIFMDGGMDWIELAQDRDRW